MRTIKIIFTFLLFLTLYSCSTSTEFASEWSINIKQKIIEDANQNPNKVIFDSTAYKLTLYFGEKKLKFYQLYPIDTSGSQPSFDTAVSINYSTDQNFELIKEFCPLSDRSFEGIRYKGEQVGLVEFRYCNGNIKERGYRFNDDVGTWIEYGINGEIINTTEHGKLENLEKLKDIKYYR